jgi:Fic family protein
METDNKFRAGRYIQQPQGYRAFIPTDLPPVPPISIDDEMWTLLSQADRALGRLDGATEALPNPDLFVYAYVRKEAVLSSQIEGTQASLIDVVEFESQAATSENPGDVEEVVNYVAAMNDGLSRLKELPLSLRLIREIHERLLQGIRGADRGPGEFRTTQNWIGASGSRPDTARHVPPPPHEMLQSLDNLEKFIHDETPMPLLVKVGLIHGQFETIHPFLDGNGRVGRLLITFLLCQRGVLQRPLLYLSYYLKQNRTEYYDRLQAVRDTGDWESWLKFFLRGVYAVAQEATATARKVVDLREEDRRKITEHMGTSAAKGLVLLEQLYSRPVVDVAAVSQMAARSMANANELVRKLVEIGVLKEISGRKRDRKFAYSAYLDLFADDAGEAQL